MTQSFNELYRSVKKCITNTRAAKVSLFGNAKRTKRKVTRFDEIPTGQYASTIKKTKKNGDCITEEKLGIQSPFLYEGGC